MTAPRRISSPARAVALLSLGSLAVHQLRYELAFGGEASAALHREGHDYLLQALPILVALAVAVIMASLLLGRGAVRLRRASALGRGVAYAAALAAVFCAQELVEGALAPGHPAGVASFVTAGGWVALPLALALGLVASLAERLLDRAEASIAAAVAPLLRRRNPSLAPRPRVGVFALRPLAASPLAFGLARRPPPGRRAV